MDGLAPFGRDDQPHLEVKILGGKRIEVAVDKYGNPLNLTKKSNHSSLNFQNQRSSSVPSSANSVKSSLPPWMTIEDTPPRKILKSLESSRDGNNNTRETTRKFSTPDSPAVLPPIDKNNGPGNTADSRVKSLTERLNTNLVDFDSVRLKEAYLSFAGLDSTLSGFVSTDQIEREFFRLQVPVRGELLNELMELFMSAHRPNWVNYEQLLKFLSDAVQPTTTKEFHVPNLDLKQSSGDRGLHKLSRNSPKELPLKPNQISPRPGPHSGRQSSAMIKKAFQDKQDTEILLQMEHLLKEVNDAREHVQAFKRTLEEQDVAGAELMSFQKLKTICLRHHTPFNNSLLDKIFTRLDRYNTGKVSWVEFISFVERALPLPLSSVSPTANQSISHGLETPPTRPMWETRQPLKNLSRGKKSLSPDKMSSQDHHEIFEEQQKVLVKHIEEQSRERSGMLIQQQRDLNCKQKSLKKDHINGPQQQIMDYDMLREDEEEMMSLEDRLQESVKRQYQLIEQKRQIRKEQEKLDQDILNQKTKLYGANRDNDPPHYVENESKVERFMKLANALYVCEQDQSGFIEADDARRLLRNYNLVNQLDFSTGLIEDTINVCSTTDGKVSVDDLIGELKDHL